MILKLNLNEDHELRSAVREMVADQIRSIIRHEVSEQIRAVLDQKIKTLLEKHNLEKMILSEITTKAKQYANATWTNQVKFDAVKIVSEAVLSKISDEMIEDVLQKRLGSGLRLTIK